MKSAALIAGALVGACITFAVAAEYSFLGRQEPEKMTIKDWLPWLNVLLLPAIYWIVRTAMAIQELLTALKSHDELDRVRFSDIGRRLDRIENRAE